MPYYMIHGQGLNDIKVLRTPYRVQRGRGFYYKGKSLAFLSRIARMLMPIVKRAGRAIGREALNSGINMMDDAERNPDMPITEIIKNRTKQSVRNLSEQAMKKLNNNLSGEGLRRRSIKSTNKDVKRLKDFKLGVVKRVTNPKPKTCTAGQKKNKNKKRSKDLFDDVYY